MARILALLQPLMNIGVSLPGRADAVKLRKVELKSTVFLTETVKPALHLVIGDELALDEDERGYRINFPIAFKLIISEQREPEVLAMELSAFIQTAIEADAQLSNRCGNGLASAVKYQGDRPSLT